VVEFAMVAPLAIVVTLAVAQFALFLYERNVVMGSLSEGARVAASTGRSISDGQLAAARLLRESLGDRFARAVVVQGAVEDGLAVLRTDAALPSFVPGLSGLRIHMTASMHREDDLGVTTSAAGSEATSGGRAGAETGHGAAPDGEGRRR
jgi:hypothetical protein